jgi:hypothetical protein
LAPPQFLPLRMTLILACISLSRTLLIPLSLVTSALFLQAMRYCDSLFPNVCVCTACHTIYAFLLQLFWCLLIRFVFDPRNLSTCGHGHHRSLFSSLTARKCSVNQLVLLTLTTIAPCFGFHRCVHIRKVASLLESRRLTPASQHVELDIPFMPAQTIE